MDTLTHISALKRDVPGVLATLKEKNNQSFASKPTKIYVPTRYMERNLAYVGSESYIVGIFGIVIEDKIFASNIACAMMQISPTSYKKVLINAEEYFEFYFEPGSVIFTNLELVKQDTLVYQIYDELFGKGNIPWYLDYLGLSYIFDTAKDHANANIGENREITEIMASLICRDKKDPNRYYRQAIKSLDDIQKNPPMYIAMKSVVYAATNTLNKIAGSYMGDGVISALVNPTEEVSHVEALLRA